jgi:hypothetical protein
LAAKSLSFLSILSDSYAFSICIGNTVCQHRNWSVWCVRGGGGRGVYNFLGLLPLTKTHKNQKPFFLIFSSGSRMSRRLDQCCCSPTFKEETIGLLEQVRVNRTTIFTHIATLLQNLTKQVSYL